MQYAIIAKNGYDSDVIYQTNIFLEHIENTKSLATLKTYTNKISVFVDWWHVTPLANTLESHLESFKKYIDGKYKSARSKNLMLSVVRGLMRYLYKEGIIKVDVAGTLENFDVGEGHAKAALSDEQRFTVLKHIREATGTYADRNRALVLLSMYNGLRANEIANINIEDFDEKEGDRVLHLLRKGYSDKSCWVIINPEIAFMLDLFIGARESGPLFVSQRGTALTSDSVSKITKEIFRACGFDSKSLTHHSLRHTFGMMCVDAGVHITQIMVAMNHKHLSSSEVYIKARDRHTKSAEKALSITL